MKRLLIPFIAVSLLVCNHFTVSAQFVKNSSGNSPRNAKMPAPLAAAVNPPATQVQQKMEQGQLLFTENKGQVADVNGKPQHDILFSAHQGAANIYLNKTGISYQFTKTISDNGTGNNNKTDLKGLPGSEPSKPIAVQTHRFDMKLEGANPNPKVRKELQNEYFENFYLAHCPDGITNVHTYARVVYENIYPNIDWVVYSNNEKGFKYDFVVHPGGNPSDIRIVYKDADGVNLNENGSLTIKTRLGDVAEDAPYTYQQGRAVKNHFVLKGNRVSFSLDDKYDTQKDLVIDPSIVWSTYYGGSGNEAGNDCAVDNSGNVYLSGMTTSSSGVASNGYQNTFAGGVNDAFLVKFSSSGSRLWSTYYGGSNYDIGLSCAIDDAGNVYLAGRTASTTGIAAGGYQDSSGGYEDAFLVKFSPGGSRLWATYFGGYDNDFANSCATDNVGNVYLAGRTFSTTGIASGGYQNTFGGSLDAFLVKFSSTGTLTWATYFGSSDVDEAVACTVDNNGNVFLTGSTYSTSGIASGGFQNVHGGGLCDAFLAKFSSTGSLLWSTYCGGNSIDMGASCVTDISGDVYMAGQTSSTTGIASGGFQNTPGGNLDAFLVKFSATGSRLWGTYYGDSGTADCGFSCATDIAGNVFLAGQTNSVSGIAYNGIQNTIGGGTDAFLVKFTSAGTRIWSSYFGGVSDEIGFSCAVSGNNNLYLAGNTGSSSGISLNGFQNTFGGSIDAFLTKIYDCSILASVNITASANNVCSNFPVIYTATPVNGGTNPTYQWQVNGNQIAGATNVTFNYVPANNDTVSCVLFSSDTCALPHVATSNGIVTNVAQFVTPAVTVTANPGTGLGDGEAVIFFANITNGGTNPQYQWRKNGVDIAGATQSTYNTVMGGTGLKDGDSITVLVQNVDPCTNPDTAISTALTVTNTTGINDINKNQSQIELFPNPNNGSFILSGNLADQSARSVVLRIYNMVGQKLYEEEVKVKDGIIDHKMELSSKLAAGTYLLKISGSETRNLKFQVTGR